MRTHLIVLGLCAIVGSAGACASGAQDPGQAPEHPGLSNHQFAAAVHIARRQLHGIGATVRIATALAGHGTVTDSNTGHQCLSGTLLHIEIIGDFRTGTGGAPVQSMNAGGSGHRSDVVRAMLIEGDPVTQQACLVGVKTGRVKPDPHATTLFTH